MRVDDEVLAVLSRAESVGLGIPYTTEPRPSHAELLTLIGEIDGIDLESEGHGIAVYLHIGGRRLKIIYDGGENISHHITRTGIAVRLGVPNNRGVGLRAFAQSRLSVGLCVNPITKKGNGLNNPTQKLNHIALVQAIKDSQDSFMLRLELFAVIAAEMKAKYDALVSAGFTSEQAMELCKSRAI